ncbi:glycosyltransferase family 4 protein [Sediminitomix flava]|nr:glycosyltransferase family 1 protein [Sediminitomix flava]
MNQLKTLTNEIDRKGLEDVTMVSCQHFHSGIGNYGFELANNLRKLDLDVTVYKPQKASYNDSHFHDYDWIKGYSYRSLGSLHPYLLPLFIRKKLLFKKASIFHAHWFLSGLALSNFKKPLIVTMHDVSLLHIVESTSRYQDYYRWALRRMIKNRIPIIVVSEQAKQDAIKFANYPEDLVHVVYNGINHQRFFPLDEIPKNDKFRIVYSGGLGKRKNVGLLLHAFKKLEDRFKDIELLIAGAFPERTEYPRLALELGLNNVKFTGYLPDEEMNNFYNSADLMIYPSLYEGFGFAPLEAMVTNTAVLSAKGGALNEVSGKGCETFEYNENDLVEKASFIIENAEERKKLAEKGRKWALSYTWEKSAMDTFQLYQCYS